MRFNEDDIGALNWLLKRARSYTVVFGDRKIVKDCNGRKKIARISRKKAGAHGQLHSLQVSL